MFKHLHQPVNFSNSKHLTYIWISLVLLISIPLTVLATLNARQTTPKATVSPNDICYTAPGCAVGKTQWGPQNVNAPQAWDVTTGSTNVKVAVIGTGIRTTGNTDVVNEFQGQIGPGFNAINGGSTEDDFTGKGLDTLTASIIGANGNNRTGTFNGAVAGLAWDVTLMPVKVCDSYCNYHMEDIAEGINWAVDNGANIIHISMGITTSIQGDEYPDPLVDAAVANAVAQGKIVIASAGNVASKVGYPGTLPGVITVGASNQSDQVYSASGRGSEVDLVAPGETILTLVRAGCCLTSSGSELGAAHVSGAAALLLSAGVPAAQVDDALFAGARDIGPVGKDNDSGYGILDICAALNAGGVNCPPNADNTPPTVTIDSPTNSATVSNDVAINATAADNVAVSKVEFYIDGVLKSTDTLAPYSYTWNSKTVANGNHTILAKAIDSSSNDTSANVIVAVSNIGNLTGRYFNSNNFTDQKKTDIIPNSRINYNWGAGSPDSTIGTDNFSASWEGTFTFEAGRYRFQGKVLDYTDDVRIYVDGVKIADRSIMMTPPPGTATTPNQTLYIGAHHQMTAGNHVIKIEFIETTGEASILFNMVRARDFGSANSNACYDVTADYVVNSIDLGQIAQRFGPASVTNPFDVVVQDPTKPRNIGSIDLSQTEQNRNAPTCIVM